MKINKKEILILGDGFLAQAFEREGYEIFSRKQNRLDVCSLATAGATLNKKLVLGKYKCVINCLGNSDTRDCENDLNKALHINGTVPGYLSQICNWQHIKFLHISSGCVYDNYTVPQKETDFIVAHCNYVISKIVGENNLNMKKDLCLRPRLLYGDFEPKGRNNLLKKLKDFDKFTTELNSFTSVHTIVNAIPTLLESDCSGIFNISDVGNLSMSDIANEFCITHNIIPIKELREKLGLYLVNSIMDTSKISKYFQAPNILDEMHRCWNKL